MMKAFKMKSLVTTAFAFLMLVLSLTHLDAAEFSLEQLRAARKEASHRQRRVIFNNDGNEPIYNCTDTTAEGLLRHRTSPLLGSHVDSIFYCTWSSGFGMFTHDTKVGYVFKTKEDLFSKNMITEMLAAGTDPLKVMVDFGKKNNIEIFWSLRMNDTHDAGLSGYGPVMFRANPLKLAHPEWLISAPDKRPKFGGWSAVDFTRPEIRDLVVKYVEEVCQNYDVDGVELDFFRHPVFFKRAAMSGTVCNDDERAMMTEMMRRVREVTEKAGLKRKRPILVAIRVPDSVSYCRNSGLDVEAWMQKDLVDLLMASGYFQLSNWEESVALGKKYDVRVYPSLDESRVRDAQAKKMRMSAEAYRGRVLAAHQAGMDGAYLFNSFNPNNIIWRELGDPTKLVMQDHDYFASIRGVGAAAGGALPHQKYQTVATLNPGAKIRIEPGKTAEVNFYSGTDPSKLNVAVSPKIDLRLQYDGGDPKNLRVQFNGEELKGGKQEQNWIEYQVSPNLLSGGQNRVTVTCPQDATAANWSDLHCKIRWSKKD